MILVGLFGVVLLVVGLAGHDNGFKSQGMLILASLFLIVVGALWFRSESRQ